MCVIASFGQVSNPLLWFVVTLLLDSEVSDSKTTSGKEWNVELHSDWRLLPHLVIFSRCCVDDSGQDVLLITLELFDSPHYCGFIRLVLSLSGACAENLDVS